ncbi:cytochrome B [Methyloceanibacter superfactus]|uniref:Cytochrome B n=1 Tax=Methyloceanibacter superfactus TaxID=1774969 RepID=A0A1E3W6J4_9HYPH|nr:cytochrome b/b6 domain-containing protein [Methyloceanibacter superfactus]ODS01429.1 cytochrome B [Methyloceanibacter superfactus]
MTETSTQSLRSYAVWDRPTRWFHWINFVCVVALAALGTAMLYGKELGVTDDGKLLLKSTHVLFGYVFAINLAWRIVWAFIGNRHAGWSALLPFGKGYGAALKDYVGELLRGDVRPYLGHNPVARLMVSLLLLLLVVQAATGLVLAGTDIYYPPFGGWITGWIAAPGVDPATIVPYDKTGIDPASWEAMRAFRLPFVTVHYWNSYALLVLIVIHIGGVVVTELREGGGIVSAMFTGRKIHDRTPVDHREPGA